MNAYHHESISALAKSLKKQLADRTSAPGHSDLLQMLAKATGNQNYQSWLASRPLTAEPSPPGATEPITLRLNWHREIIEVFSRDSAGQVLDRRQSPVERIFVLAEVELRLKTGGVKILSLKASVDTKLFPERGDPEDWLRPFVMPALLNLVEFHPERLTVIGTIDLPIDRQVAEDDRSRPNDSWRVERTVQMAKGEFLRLCEECQKVDHANKDFERVKQRLWDILGHDNPSSFARRNRQELLSLADYLDGYPDAQGEILMGNWAHEKWGAIADSFRRFASRPASGNAYEWLAMRHNALAAETPRFWNRLLAAPALSTASTSAKPVLGTQADNPLDRTDPAYATLLCGPGDAEVVRVPRDSTKHVFHGADGVTTVYVKKTDTYGKLESGRTYGHRYVFVPAGTENEVWQKRLIEYSQETAEEDA